MNLKKGLFACVALACSALVCFPSSLPADLINAKSAINASAIAYSGECGENAKWQYVKESNTLIISGTGEASGPFYDSQAYQNYIRKLIILDGITSIKNMGFFNLNEISIPESVTDIADNTFQNTIWLKNKEKKWRTGNCK